MRFLRQVQITKDWEYNQLESFGFSKTFENEWKENPLYRGDTKLTLHADRTLSLSVQKSFQSSDTIAV